MSFVAQPKTDSGRATAKTLNVCRETLQDSARALSFASGSKGNMLLIRSPFEGVYDRTSIVARLYAKRLGLDLSAVNYLVNNL
jgi:hypothetical protein